MKADEHSLYARLGGEPALRRFVERFYGYMDSLPEAVPIRQLHRMSLDEAGHRLFRFLSGWLGGPRLFHQAHGEPRLRRRHLHIGIGERERDLWLVCASKALDDMPWAEPERSELSAMLRQMADHMRNRPSSAIGPGESTTDQHA